MKKYDMGQKTIKYAINGGLIFGTTNALLEIIEQLNNNPKGHKINWNKVAKAGGKGLLLGASGGAIIGSIYDFKNDNQQLLNTSIILGTMLTDISLDKESSQYIKLSNKADCIVDLIKAKMQSKLGKEPIRIGSSEDGSALQEDFDIDIAFQFKKNSFSSINEMFQYLSDFIQEYYIDDDLIKIRIQKKSLGLFFEIDNEEFKIDLVPAKLSNDKSVNSAAYLMVNDKSLFGKNTYTKTDISKLSEIKLTPTQTKLLVILKRWKIDNSVKISSHLLRLIIIDAFKKNRNKIPRDFTKKVIMVFTYIRDNILIRKITSVENTNNILTDLSQSNKRAIRKACEAVINDYNYQPNSILDQFDYS